MADNHVSEELTVFISTYLQKEHLKFYQKAVMGHYVQPNR